MTHKVKSLSVGLWRYLAVALWAFAAFALPTAAVANAIEGATEWFSENVDTFEANESGRWVFAPNSAFRDEGKIRIYADDDEAGEVLYHPTTVGDDSVVIVEQVMRFDGGCDEDSLAGGAYAGVMLIETAEDSGEFVFGVLNPTAGANSWLKTTVAAETNVDYVIRATVDYTSGSESATYAYKLPGAASFSQLAMVSLPSGIAKPTEFEYSGNGAITSIDAATKASGGASGYDRWNYANGIVTWAAEGSSYISITDESKAWFMNFKKTGDTWADDPNLVWTGGVKYVEFPGYGGEATEFWHSLVNGNTGYVAPGMVLRFVANSKAAPQVRAAQTSPSEVAIGGLIVEPGAKGYGDVDYSIYRSLTSLSAKTALGDPSGKEVTLYSIGENFNITRGYKAGSEVRFYGTIDLEVAEGKQFSINVASANLQKITNRLDEATAANLRFHGDGQLVVANLFATGAVTLDYSDQSLSRTQPFVDGSITIDGDTTIALPADLAENTPMVIASKALTSSVSAVMRPGTIDGEKALVTYIYNTTARAVSWTREPIPTVDVTIPEGYKLTIDGSADPATPYEWSGKMAVDGSLYIKGCATFTGAFALNGKLYFDGSKLAPIESGRIAVVTVGAGYTIDLNKVVNLSEGTWKLVVDGNVLYACVGGGYEKWEYARDRIVTWVTAGTTGGSVNFNSATAKFKAFNIDTMGDGATTYVGNSSYTEMPGYSGKTSYPFWNLFNGSSECYQVPGNTLRLRPYSAGDMVGSMTCDASPMMLGGLIVEEDAKASATTYSLVSTGAYETRLGDTSGLNETWFSTKENFKFARNGNMTIYGPLNVEVTEGKVLDLNSAYANRTLKLDATSKAKLRFHGKGAITNVTLTATGAVTLDFSDLEKGREPFILGSLAVDTNTVFAFPAELAEGEKFKLCRGSLTIPTENPARYIMVGEDAFYATLTFDAVSTPKTVSYVRGGSAVNRATLSSNVAWADIAWNDGKGWIEGLPAQITLTQDVRIEFAAAATVDRLCFLGGYKASLVFVKTPKLTNVTASMGAEYEYVIPQSSEMAASTGLVIPAGEIWVIEGGSDAATPRDWSGKLTVTGTLKTRGQVRLSNNSNTVQPGGTLAVADGVCHAIGASQGFKGRLDIPPGTKFACELATDYLSYGADEVTVNVWGELSLSGVRWTLGKNLTLNLYAGGEISGEGKQGEGALDFYLMKQLNVLPADGEEVAKISARIRYRNNPAFDIAEGVTLKVTDGEPIQYGGDRAVTLQGEGTFELGESAEIVLAGNSCCDGGVVGKGVTAFLTIPEDEGLMASFSDNLRWFGLVWFKGVAFDAFNPDAFGNSGSRVRVSGCRGYFPSGVHTVATTLELGEPTSAHPTAFMVESGYAKSTITIPTLTGTGRLLMAKGNATGNSAVFLPNASQLACSIVIQQEAEHIAAIAGQSAGAFSGDYSEHAGEIYVAAGRSARISTNATFSAVNGIMLPSDATLVNDSGTIGSKVLGSGTVKYVGRVGEDGIEEAAEFEDADSWHGTVHFQGTRFEGATYGRFRNDSSKVTISQSEYCTASSVKWVDGITLNAEEGDTVMRFDGEPSEGFDQLTIHLVGEPVKTFGLEYDADTGGLVLTTKASAPTMSIGDMRVVYGTDLADARVAFTVENYNEGYLYSGGTAAILTIRDSEGNAYVSKGVWIDGDGDYYFDPVELRNGRGAGYTYEITVTTMREAGSDEEFVAKGGIAEFVTRRECDWIHETAATFPPEAAGKTGEWTMDPAGVAIVTNGVIRLGDDDGNPGDLDFTAYAESKEPVVSVEITMEALAGAPEDPDKMPADMQAAITIGEDDEAGNALVFYAWSPEDSNYVKLFIAAENDRPVSGSNYTVRAVFDYDSGFVTYSVDGFALTNSVGGAFVPMTSVGSAAGKLKGVRFSGNGSIAEVTGEQRNGNLAKVDGVEYYTLDEAVGNAADGATVELLWDATWHPVSDNVGRKLNFTGDYDVFIDEDSVTTLERSGYQLVHNPDGTYLVDVTTYYLSYSGNGALGEMESMAFSATNLVLKLAANAFEYTGKDFQYWNSSPDGSGPSNYLDKAEIDLTPYGFTNVTLYAQWRVARRLVTVASADAGVYLEMVRTNYANHAGVSFYQVTESGESVSASFEVEHGSQVELYFSTDIENSLTPYNYLCLDAVTEATTAVPYADLPKIFGASMQEGLSILEQWAYAHGISASSLAASEYKTASYGLDVAPLIDEKTEVRFSDFAATETGCSFKVTVNGKAIVDREAIIDMIWVSNDLKTWVQAPTESVTIDGGTISIATTDAGKFVKIIVPKD